jgi:hypothetical protein
MFRFGFYPLINLGVFTDDTFDQSLTFQEIKAVLDLVLVWHEQRPAALRGNADLDAGEFARPAQDNPTDGSCDSTILPDEHGNGSRAPVRRAADGLTRFGIIQSFSLLPQFEVQFDQREHRSVFLAMLIIRVLLFNSSFEFFHRAKETTGLNANAKVSPEGDQISCITSEQSEVNKWTRAIINFRSVF